MSGFRSRWLALFGGVTLIALSMSTAFAGKPNGANQALEVSGFVVSLVGDVEATEDQADDETEVEDETEAEEEDSASSDHGECVSEVAHSDELGGDNENHGGAVSEAARVTCRDDSNTEEPTTEDADEDEDDSEVEADDADDADEAAEESEDDDADASDAGRTHGEGHGGGHDDKGSSSDS